MLIRQPIDMIKDVNNIIVQHYAGSHAYGTSLPTSDVDIRGVFLADPLYYLTPWYNVKEIDIPDQEDGKVYELHKFLQLLTDQNPNIVETLWVDEADIITNSPAYQILREHRDTFLSTKCAHTYSGYAHAQLKRIKGHNKWINNPKPEQPPRQIDYMSVIHCFTDNKQYKITGEDMIKMCDDHMLEPYGNNIFGLLYKKGKCLFNDKNFILNTDNERSLDRSEIPLMIVKFNYDVYKHDIDEHKNYWNWKTNRNQQRSVLEEQFGFDTKHASHLVRLLHTGLEILQEHKVYVKRPDAQYLLDIRNGKYSYEEILERAEILDKEIQKAYNNSTLRKRVDIVECSKICTAIQSTIWGYTFN